MARPPPTYAHELDPLITSYQHDVSRPRASQALHTLQKIGSLVKPIMRRRGFRVGLLSEFYPSERNLLGLNINSGQTINLRLRYPGDQNQFLPIEEVTDTMLHELCHNLIGPHDESFHRLWDELRDEYESLLRKGYTGEGFLGRGERLGGGRLAGRVGAREAGRLARQAAEERKRKMALAAGSGNRLGGTGVLRGQDPRRVIADAVERRLRIERGCASGTERGDRVAMEEKERKDIDRSVTRVEKEDEDEAAEVKAYIELIEEEERERFGGDYMPTMADRTSRRAQELRLRQKEIEAGLARSEPRGGIEYEPTSKPTKQSPALSRQNSVRNTTALNSPNRSSASTPALHLSNLEGPSRQGVQAEPQLKTWTCEICTLVNPLAYLSCDACGIERPSWVSAVLGMSTASSDTTSSNGSTQHTNDLVPRKKPRTEEEDRYIRNQLKPRLGAYDNISRFEREGREKAEKARVGWTCRCGNFMENEWWTCGRCGRMKESS